MIEIKEKTFIKEWEPTGEKIFITGYSGLVGYGIVSAALGKDSMIGFSRGITKDVFERESRLRKVEGDLLFKDQLYKTLKEIQPSLVLHLAAAADVDKCQKERDWAWRTNVVATENLAVTCGEFGIPLVAFSTDNAFPRMGGPFSEEDKPSLLTDATGEIVSVYGETKLEAERRVLKLPKGKKLIVRVVAPYDHRYKTKPGVPPTILERIKNGKPINAVIDGKNTYTYGEDIAICVNAIILNKLWEKQDIVHIAGPEQLSAYDMVQIIGKYYPLPEISKTTQDEYFKGKAPRSIEGGLKQETLDKLGYKNRTLEEWLITEKLVDSF